MRHGNLPLCLIVSLVATGCVGGDRLQHREPNMRPDFIIGDILISSHRDGDDLLSAGLGLAGLRAVTPPAPADPAHPSAAELRRRAIYSNWAGIAALHRPDGLGPWSAAIPTVPGREWSAFAQIPGRNHPHRVLAQIPDAFDKSRRCLVVAAASGSRGVYGAIAVASLWGLAHGCAVVHTDKALGNGFFDVASGQGVALDGRPSASAPLDFDPRPLTASAPARIAIKHAHSGDNPEADWGAQVLQAVAFGLAALDQAFPEQAPFTADNTRIIATGISNGGGAVLRAAELAPPGLFDAVVVAEPNITVAGARPLYDYASDAALFAPCALSAGNGPKVFDPATRAALVAARCASLTDAGLLAPGTLEAQSRAAWQHLRDGGFSAEALDLIEINVAFDLWRAVTATYSQSYGRTSVSAPVCGYGFALLDASGQPRASSAAERALWWADSGGIAPGVGIGIVDTLASGLDPQFPALHCARALWTGDQPLAQTVQASIAATLANGQPHAGYLHIVHGRSDSMIPIDFSSRPYVAAARAHGIEITFEAIPDTQHFDSFLVFPAFVAYQPTLPHLYRALDQALVTITAP